MDEEGNDKLKLHRSATSTPMSNITKLKTVTFFPHSDWRRDVGASIHSVYKKNAMHNIETFKRARE
jgi:hypothetical protein